MKKLLKFLLYPKIYASIRTFYFKKIGSKKEYELIERKRINPLYIRETYYQYFKNVTGKIVLLVDQQDSINQFIHDDRYVVIDCRGGGNAKFDVIAYDYFMYACDNADNGMFFIKKIIEAGKKFIPIQVGSAIPARFLEDDSIAKNVLLKLHILQIDDNFCKFSYGPGADFINICQFIERTKHLTGSYVEVGCYRGSSGQVAVKFMRDKKIFRKCLFLDVFNGFDYKEAQASSDAIWFNTHRTEGIDVVRKRLEQFSSPENGLIVDVRKANIISDNCIDDIDTIVMANIDVDMYDAVLASLHKIFPKVVRGGVIIVEDAGHHPNLIGARVALEDFIQSLSTQEYFLVQMESGQFIIFKI